MQKLTERVERIEGVVLNVGVEAFERIERIERRAADG
jgi:hypothetical protein